MMTFVFPRLNPHHRLRRPAEHFFATSLVAIDVTTGKPRWRFQAVKKDVWDYDLGSQATLIDYKGAPALVLPSKQGDLYVLDRRTGQRRVGFDDEHLGPVAGQNRLGCGLARPPPE